MRAMPVPPGQSVSRTARTRRVAATRPASLSLLLISIAGLLAACASAQATAPPTTKAPGGSGDPVTTTPPASSTSTSTSTSTTTTLPIKRIPPGPPADRRHLVLIKTIGGHISPKSVDASDTGLVFAQNMMYTHTVTVYDSAGDLVKTIPDTVDMSLFGYPGSSRHHPRRTGGGGVHARLAVRLRFELLHVRRRHGPRGQRRLHACFAPRRPATRTATSTGSTPGRSGSTR